MSILIHPTYMTHEGGTKFYEVIRLTDEKSGVSVVANRWGPNISFASPSGGQIKIMSHGDGFSAEQDAISKIASKKKGGYSTSKTTFGLHLKSVVPPGIELGTLAAHFGKATAEAILEKLNTGTMEDDAHVSKVAPEPVKHIDRGSDWGSW